MLVLYLSADDFAYRELLSQYTLWRVSGRARGRQFAICACFVDTQCVEYWQMCKWNKHAILWSLYAGDLLMFL